MTRRHVFEGVTHGWWFYRGQCSCGWRSRRRLREVWAEASVMLHQRRAAKRPD